MRAVATDSLFRDTKKQARTQMLTIFSYRNCSVAHVTLSAKALTVTREVLADGYISEISHVPAASG